MNGEAGKGSARRKGANDAAFRENFDRIFRSQRSFGLGDKLIPFLELPSIPSSTEPADKIGRWEREIAGEPFMGDRPDKRAGSVSKAE